jgi:chromosome segregation ATPase
MIDEIQDLQALVEVYRQKEKVSKENFSQEKASYLAQLKEMQSRQTQVKEELAFMTIDSMQCAALLEKFNKEKLRLEATLEKQRSGFEQENAKLADQQKININMIEEAWAKRKLDLDRLTKEKDELGQQVIDQKENLTVEIKRLTNDIEKLGKKSKTEELERNHDKIKIPDLKEEIEQKGFESMQLQYDIGKFLNISCLYVECLKKE